MSKPAVQQQSTGERDARGPPTDRRSSAKDPIANAKAGQRANGHTRFIQVARSGLWQHIKIAFVSGELLRVLTWPVGFESVREILCPYSVAPLEHRVRIFCLLWNYLKHVPVLDDLSIGIKSKYIDASPVSIRICGPFLVTVQHNVIAFRDDTLEGDALARVLPGHAFEVLDEGPLAVGYVRVVLGVTVSGKALDCFSRLVLVEHQIVKVQDCSLVSLEDIHSSSLTSSACPPTR